MRVASFSSPLGCSQFNYVVTLHNRRRCRILSRCELSFLITFFDESNEKLFAFIYIFCAFTNHRAFINIHSVMNNNLFMKQLLLFPRSSFRLFALKYFDEDRASLINDSRVCLKLSLTLRFREILLSHMFHFHGFINF